MTKKINWLIFSSHDRGTEFGVGTFIRELSLGLSEYPQINVIVVELGLTEDLLFNIEKKGSITFFKFPSFDSNKQNKVYDTRTNQTRVAKVITRLIKFHLPQADTNIVHLNYIFQYFIGTELKNQINGRILFTQHLFVIPQSELKENIFDIEAAIYNLADHIITVTNHGKAHLIAKKVDSSKIKVIYNGINPQRFNIEDEDVCAKYDIVHKKRLVFYSGRLDEIKGLKYLFAAFQQVILEIPNCQLVLAGNGDWYAMINDTKYISSHVNFLGVLPFSDVVAFYRCSSIGVIPSLEEHCSYVALEMLFCGLPVVASKVGGLQEIFTHGENSLLADMKPCSDNSFKMAPDVSQLADYIKDLLINNHKREQFSANGKKKALKEYTGGRMVDNYINLINTYLS